MKESLGTCLKQPVLFALNLPPAINYDHLRFMFKSLLVTRITLSARYLIFCPTREGWSRLLLPGLQTAKIEFEDIAEAEKAFDKMNFCPIPNIFPPEILKLSASPGTDNQGPLNHRDVDSDGYGPGRHSSPKAGRDSEFFPISSLETSTQQISKGQLDGRVSMQRASKEDPQDCHDASSTRERPIYQQSPHFIKRPTPHVDTLQEEKATTESILKQTEIDRDHWRRKVDVFQSRVKELEFQIEEERKKAAKEMECQRDSADRDAREHARKGALFAEIERCRQRDAGLCKWERSAALERFRLVLDEYEGRTHPGTVPLTFEGVPWPTLDNPMVSSFQAGAITWEKVEAFFSYAKQTMPHQRYSKLVEKVHRLFHPDKWRARRVLDTVPVDIRQTVEQSVNIVAQAMTPIWRESKRSLG
ncbi:hypothetical protein C0992_009275 [Termitomyces sp. T32_za158]|nr:hypothetical protein C0992_009275 [Termitomyces sp. T32_za158]